MYGEVLFVYPHALSPKPPNGLQQTLVLEVYHRNSHASFILAYTGSTLHESHSLQTELTLKVFQNKVPKRIFGPKGKEVTGDWRKFHIGEELQICTLYQIRLG
jgi:hypothetical protein